MVTMVLLVNVLEKTLLNDTPNAPAHMP